jgi:hypothetical protein
LVDIRHLDYLGVGGDDVIDRIVARPVVSFHASTKFIVGIQLGKVFRGSCG